MTIDELNRLTLFWDRHRLPKEQIIWANAEQSEKWLTFIKNLGSGNTLFVTIPNSNPEIESIMLLYNGYKIYIVEY